jgi:hypothetical protein
MVTKELRMRMASPESCFQAETAVDCAEAFRKWTSQTPQNVRLSLHGTIQIFCSGKMQPDLCNSFARLGPLNLFVIVSGKSYNVRTRCMA